MCCCKLKTLTTCGWIFTLIFGLLGIACIVLAAIPYELTRFDWASGTKYQSLGVITIIAVCVVVVAMIFGFVQFCCCAEKCCYGVFFLIIQAACALFTFGISIFGLVSGSMGKMDDYVGCNSDYKGILGFWNNMDHLFTLVDIGFCSNDCNCYINAEAEAKFIANSSSNEYLSNWKYSQDDSKAITFANCTDDLQSYVGKTFEKYDKSNGDHIGKFNITTFAGYWEYVENKFKCTGFCKTDYDEDLDYHNSVKNEYKGGFYKYLFSDINKGVVENIGCLKSIFDWLSPLLLSYGIIAFVCSLLAIWTWLLGIFLLCHCYKKEKGDDKDTKK